MVLQLELQSEVQWERWSGQPSALGEQLQLLVPFFTRKREYDGEFYVLWDFCSLPQHKQDAEGELLEARTALEDALFKAGLGMMSGFQQKAQGGLHPAAQCYSSFALLLFLFIRCKIDFMH